MWKLYVCDSSIKFISVKILKLDCYSGKPIWILSFLYETGSQTVENLINFICV